VGKVEEWEIMHVSFNYKTYEESKIATIFSITGGVFNIFGKIIPVTFIVQLIKAIAENNKTGESNLLSIIIFSVILSIVMFIIGFIFNIIAKKIALKEREKRLQLNCEEIDDLIYKKPELKKWFLDNHPDYRLLHRSDIGYKNVDDINTEVDDKKIEFAKKKKRLLIFYFCSFLLVAIAIALFQNDNGRKVNKSESNYKSSEAKNVSSNNGKNSDAEYDKKYQCYVEFNNDIVDCYNQSIDLYFKSKGNSEILKHKYNPNKVDMGPILKQKYDNIEKVKKAANSDPKIEIDEDVIKLADATQKVYDLISEIYYAYGGNEEYGKKNDKTKEQLHKEFYNYVKEYDEIYSNFNKKFDKVSIEHMQSELKKYEYSEDMDSYHTLNMLIKSEELYRYFIDNNITNKNLFSMNLDEYKKLLDDYNKAYLDFQKQDIKGGTTHTSGFKEFVQAYHSFVNNIVNMVNNKTFDAGELDAKPGLVGPDDEEDIQARLYFYIDRMVSEYNSIQLFKK
jgi:hypothetical protein